MRRTAGAKVESVGFESRNLVTIAPDDPFWEASPDGPLVYPREKFAGAIVRLQPPAGATDELLAGVRKFLAASGVAAMRFESAAQAAVAPERPHRAHLRLVPREVVMAMADERPRREELRQLLDLELAKVGL